MADPERARAAEILLVDSSPGDAELIRSAFEKISVPFRLRVLQTGREALQFCRRELRGRSRPGRT